MSTQHARDPNFCKNFYCKAACSLKIAIYTEGPNGYNSLLDQ